MAAPPSARDIARQVRRAALASDRRAGAPLAGDHGHLESLAGIQQLVGDRLTRTAPQAAGPGPADHQPRDVAGAGEVTISSAATSCRHEA